MEELSIEDFYRDQQGRMVFTAQYHLRRGYCCKSGCRHCPYGFELSEEAAAIPAEWQNAWGQGDEDDSLLCYLEEGAVEGVEVVEEEKVSVEVMGRGGVSDKTKR